MIKPLRNDGAATFDEIVNKLNEIVYTVNKQEEEIKHLKRTQFDPRMIPER